MTKKFIEEYVSINGISQYFLHIPNESKDVVIMLHGGPGIPNSYLAYYHQPYLDFCNVVYYDQRGAGKTQIRNKTKAENLSMDILLEDLKQATEYVKDKYKTERIFLVGHSCGSMLGTLYIIKFPNDVFGYIGYGQMIDIEVSDKSWYKHLKATVLKSGEKKDIKKINTVNANFPNIPRDEFVKATVLLSDLELKYGFKINDIWKLYKKSPLMKIRDTIQMIKMNISGEISQKLIGDVFYEFDIRNITEYQVPIYYVLGRHDEWTSSIMAAEYFETIIAPKKGLYWIENAGHMTDTDNPSAFFSAIKGIITQR